MSFIGLRKTLFTVLLCTALQNIPEAQPAYRPPLDIPLLLSGTFAELRSDHFHSGVDFRTQGVEGHKIFAIEDGYVSRVAVAPGGFGKAIYLDHPSTGHTSVYAHLQRFHGKLADYVKSEQYQAQNFTVNLLPEAGRFPVKKGDIIGFSGNSGSSGGPHLHFEIRDSRSQWPLNPAQFGFPIQDNIKPSITKLMVYPANEQARVNGYAKMQLYEVQGTGENHYLRDKAEVKAQGAISFGISTFDMHNGTPNKNGVYSVELFVDAIKVFHFAADRFSFDETRYINSMIDYSYLKKHHSRLIRTAKDPLNKLSMADYGLNNGVLLVTDTALHQALFRVTDHFGNISLLRFSIRGNSMDKETNQPIKPVADNFIAVKAGQPKEINNSGLLAVIPDDAFYRDEFLSFDVKTGSPAFLSDIYTLGDKAIPVHKAITIAIKPKQTGLDTKRLMVARIEDDNKPVYAGNTIESDGRISAKTRNMGRFALVADSIPPSIKPLNFTKQAKITELKQLRVEIDDRLSGIADYKPSLNGAWLLMDYDPKNKLLVYEIDERMLMGKNRFELRVTDKCGNMAVFVAELEY